MYSTASGPGWIPATNALAQPLSTPSSTTREAASAPIVPAVPDSRLAASAIESSAEVVSSADAPAVATVASQATPGAAAFNIKVVSNASPDLTDLQSLVDSTTSLWVEKREKVWALFYWSHILKRQTSPIVLHGTELTDPIRNLTDYGYTMCSTVTGINQSLYEAIGLRHQVLGHL